MNLDQYQQQAAYHNYPYSLIIAGAGTGKTYTLLGRIQYLMEHQNLDPNQILIVSYTNETVLDFQKKAFQLLGKSFHVMTFHKLAIYILKELKYQFFLTDDNLLNFICNEFLESYCRNNLKLRKCLLQTFYFWGFGSLQKLYRSGSIKQLRKELVQFVHLWLAKGYTSDQILDFYKTVSRKEKNFLILCFLLLQIYQSEKESQLLVDFDDLIIMATKQISNLSSFPFCHILIDEFQDSSLVRINFFKELVQFFNLKFTLVGDDCQSIYRFSGTEPNCFTMLQTLFPTTKIFYLKNTYRNSQELIDIANFFVLKNPHQISKTILSSKHLNHPIEILFYRDSRCIFSMLDYFLPSCHGTILFLGRNSFDWKYYFRGEDILWKDKKHFSLLKYPDYLFTFLTVHQSKGLEADIVILLHAEDGRYGFPNRLALPKYMRFIFSPDVIPYEEERRLFYVALTRTKGKIYIFSSVSSPSIFVKELLKYHSKSIITKYF